MKNKMAFFTRLSKNSNFLILPLILLLCSHYTAAEGISVTRAQANITSQGKLAISSRFKTDLPEQLKQVLHQGVPLNFDLSYQLNAPTLASYRFRLGQLVSTDNQITYKLSYHPLTNRYRVAVGTFSTEYNTLDTALRGVGAIANWEVLSQDALSGRAPSSVKADIRLSLSTSQLPKPFQINALTSRNWNLDSGWKALIITKE